MAAERVVAVSALPEGTMRAAVLRDGREIVVARFGPDRIAAFPAACPHQGAPLLDGCLNGAQLTCAAHRWRFDLTTGAGIFPKSCSLGLLKFQIIDDWVTVESNS